MLLRVTAALRLPLVQAQSQTSCRISQSLAQHNLSRTTPFSRTASTIRAYHTTQRLHQQRYIVPNQPKEPAFIPPPPPAPPRAPPRDRAIRAGFFALAVVLAFSTGWMLASQPTVVTAIAVLTQPSDEKTLELWNPDPNTPTGAIEAKLQQLALVQQLNNENEGDQKKWQASRPHLKIPPNLRPANFTGGDLLAEDKLTVPPLVYVDGGGKELVCFVYLGNKVCGHPGMVHGGLLATLIDEGLARCCFAQLPNKVGVTANLNINYRAPCRAGQFVVLKAETVKVEGRKAWVKGRIETVTPDGSPGRVLVEGEALYVEPRGYATKLMRITQ